MNPMKSTHEKTWRLVVVGTGTGIGKTHASVALLTALKDHGCLAAGVKPVESGVTGTPGEETDAGQLRGASLFHVKHSSLHNLRAAVSPHLAARLEGRDLDPEGIVDWVLDLDAPILLVETAGGLLSPIAPGFTNLDLALSLQPDALLLVAPDRLGVLHDISACLRVLAAAPTLPPARLLLQAPAEADITTGTNAAELITLDIHPRPHVFPRAPSSSASLRAAVGDLLRDLGVPSPTRT